MNTFIWLVIIVGGLLVGTAITVFLMKIFGVGKK